MNSNTCKIVYNHLTGHDEMVFLRTSNASKHVLLAFGVDRTARDAVKMKFTGVLT